MFTVKKRIHFSYAHRLLNYKGKCELMHGHNGVADIELSAMDLDNEDMVCDFTKIKDLVGGWIKENLDHKVLICKDDPVLKALRDVGQVCFVMNSNPTAEMIAKEIFDHAVSCGLPVSSAGIWETDDSLATYTA